MGRVGEEVGENPKFVVKIGQISCKFLLTRNPFEKSILRYTVGWKIIIATLTLNSFQNIKILSCQSYSNLYVCISLKVVVTILKII